MATAVWLAANDGTRTTSESAATTARVRDAMDMPRSQQETDHTADLDGGARSPELLGIPAAVHVAVMAVTPFEQTRLSEAPDGPTFMTDRFVDCYEFADALEALSYASAVSWA